MKTKKRYIAETDTIVDIYLETEDIGKEFLADAISEGFTVKDEISPHNKMWVCIHDDKSITYPPYHTWGGAMAFHHSKLRNKRVVLKVDYQKYKNKKSNALKRC